MTLPQTMHAMVLHSPGEPLRYELMPVPKPAANEVLVKVSACGVCRTDLHVVDFELPNPKLPLIPGHEIIGTVAARGAAVTSMSEGELVGIPWLGYTCGRCRYCKKGLENLCENALFTGYTIDGGYAEFTVANMRYCFPLASVYGNPSAAPLLCAGLIGFRSYNLIRSSSVNIGIYGFGGAAHILIQIALQEGKKVFAFTREGDEKAKEFALSLGAAWAGDSFATAPEPLDAAIIFAPAGELVPAALKQVDKGGTVVCGGIHMSDIPSFPYSILWGERTIRSVANLTRKDAVDFFSTISKFPVSTETTLYPLKDANTALADLRDGKISGAAVLTIE